jgi:ABC-type multidrug transport system fused ATPase/permease subunit
VPSAEPVHLHESLRLEHVVFRYDGQARAALDDVSLTIRPHQSVGLVGRSGAGKTTVADLILGLHQPSVGRIVVDDVVLEGATLRAWRQRVGYVPQHVFLANSTVWENIALGVPADRIDREAVRRAAHLAQATDFIDALPQQFDTFVGERGVKLSGGQQQRLGIARALYHRPDILVFDEATSALDGLTEDFVMDAIRSLAGELTIILIAHRLRTVEACDRIIMLDAGRVAAEGTFAELQQSSAHFQRMLAHPLDLGTTRRPFDRAGS